MLGWILRIVLGLAAGVTLYVTSASVLRKYKVTPLPEPDPDDVHAVNLPFRLLGLRRRGQTAPRRVTTSRLHTTPRGDGPGSFPVIAWRQ